MWKITLITALAAILGQGSARNLAGPPGSNVAGPPGFHRVARAANELMHDHHDHGCPEDCSEHHDTIHVMVHYPYDRPEHHDGCCGDKVVHIHMGNDIYHGNAIPGAEQWAPGKFTFAKCELVSGSKDISGTIYMKQNLMAGGPVSTYFDLSGFHQGHAHSHNFTVNWHGNTADQCVHTGGPFVVPHGRGGPRGGHGGHGDHGHAGHPSHDEHDDHRAKRSHHGDHSDEHSHHGQPDGSRRRGRTESVIGDLACEEDGTMILSEELDMFTLMGLHSVYGRSIVIRNSNEPDSAPLACCTISHSSGVTEKERELWTDYNGRPLEENKWLITERDDYVEEDSHHGHGDGHHGHH